MTDSKVDLKSSDDSRSVCVIGGGIAGLSAAVFLKQKGFKVILIEAAPKLGGRAYSFFDKTINDFIDNGQHIFASWYENTFEFLKIIGSFAKLTFQKQLEVNFADKNGQKFKLKCPKLPPPFHLISGIMKYRALELKDKNSIIMLMKKIKKLPDEKLKGINTDELFVLTNQTEKAVEYFWKPFIIAVFNAEPKDTSACLFAEMLKTGFLKKGNSNLVLPDDFLIEIFAEPAVKYLKESETEVINSARVSKINFNSDSIESIIIDNRNSPPSSWEARGGVEIKADFYISAVSFFDFKNLIGDEVYNKEFKMIENLRSSPIVNIHLKFDAGNDEIMIERFIGLLSSPVHWVFRVKNDQVCVVISSAKDAAEMDKETLIDLVERELFKYLPEMMKYKIVSFKIIKEKRATFKPDKKSLMSRPANKTKYKNFFIAGDWTDTGLPTTIEGAVKSSKNCVNEILKSI